MQRRLPPISTSVSGSTPSTQAQPSSNSSPFSPQTSQQQASSGQLQSRARIASSAKPQSPSAAGLPIASQGGASATSGGGSGQSSRLARASPSLSQTASPSTTGTPSGLSRLVLTQIFILLGTINQEKDKAKRDSQAEQISDMLSQHGMEVFPKVFRRILQFNADYIFGHGQPQGSYELLNTCMQNVRKDSQEADKIAESLDTTEGDLFKNFDVSKFMEHFKLDPIAKSMLALSLKHASKPDLRTKADAILAHNYQALLLTILNPTSETGDDLPATYLLPLLERLINDPPRNWNDDSPTDLAFAVRSRFDKLHGDIPQEILRVLQISQLLDGTNQLVKLLQKHGPRATSTIDDCKDVLGLVEAREVAHIHVANALLFMVMSQDLGQQYDASTFVDAIKDHKIGKRLDWQDVIGSFDRGNLAVTKSQFLALYRALLPLAQDYENFDIQLLWGGEWTHKDTQLSFVVSFLSCNADEIDASTITRLRKAYDMDDFEDASDEVKAYAARAVRHPFVSFDATKALFETIFHSTDDYAKANMMGIPTAVINPHTDCFVLATGSVPRPWGTLQTQAFNQLFVPFLRKRVDGADFVFHGLWKRENSIFLAQKLVEAYHSCPSDLHYIYEQALHHGWLESLTSIMNDFGVDLAAYAHSYGQFDLESWLETQNSAVLDNAFAMGLARIVEQKARLEMTTQRAPEQKSSQSPSFSVKTVFVILNFLQPHLPEDILVTILKVCINAYPRLINYGEGLDEVIDANGSKGHQLSAEADQIMNEHFKTLYSGETKVRDVIQSLRRFKESEDPKEQELFACMINGLFDEYNCFAEYPVDALSTTAVLFGGIINFNLLSPISLQVALAMVLEAIQSSKSREEKMYKFGLQALKQFQERLSEWPSFCERLLRIDALQGTEIWTIADHVVRNENMDEVNDAGTQQVMTNGHGDNAVELESQAFHCIHPDPPLREEFYEAPSEEVQDKVLFVLNNISAANIMEKHPELTAVLDTKHHQWLAEYIVEERAKLQANFQNLYLRLLELFDDSALWQEVIRSTYISVARLLNHEATMTSAAEKNHLKSLGSWLGSVTLARDVPIKLRNLSLQDLLVEAYNNKRLPIAIPFTAKVLTEASKSEIFQPPNPWCNEVLRVLLELYHHADLRINLKFEIEALCSALEFDIKEAPANVIRPGHNRSIVLEDDFNLAVTDGLEGFGDMTIQMRNRASRGSFSPDSLANGLPDISSRLIYPPNSNAALSNEQVQAIFASAAMQAITEIIYPVVERSVTIAAIATSQLVTKDFALEADENKLRNAAQNMVKSLSGSLAMVTCREPLRMSMSNHVRNNSRTLQTREEPFPEGVILMFVNDNIDVVCRVIEEAAEKHSAAEIENQIREAIQLRQIHHASRPDEVFNHPPVSKYAYIIPEPYKPSPAGLRPEQLAIYDNFGATRSLAGHHNGGSQDARQQLPDIMQDQFSATVPTATDASAVLRQATQQRILNAQSAAAIGLPQTNGFNNEPLSLAERIEHLYSDLIRAARDSPEQNVKALSMDSPVRGMFQELTQAIEHSGAQRDNVALYIGQRLPVTMYNESESRLEIEVAVQLLAILCQLSVPAARTILVGLASLAEEQILDPTVSVALVSAQLLDLRRIDSAITKGIKQGKIEAIGCLNTFVEEMLLSEQTSSIRSSFASSFEILTQWLHDHETKAPGQLSGAENDQEAVALGHDVMNKLRVQPAGHRDATSDSQQADELAYVFEEWVHLQRSELVDKSVATFIHQLGARSLLKTSEQVGVFIRLSIDTSIEAYYQEETAPYGGSVEQAYTHIDALAALLVALCVYHGDASDPENKDDSSSFLDSILSVVVLHQCDHWKLRGDLAKPKVFFRLFSSIISEIHRLPTSSVQHGTMYLVFAKALLATQPNYLPGFVFAWFGLVSHRDLVPALLAMDNPLGPETYLQLLQLVFDTTAELSAITPDSLGHEITTAAQEYLRGVLRLMVVLHHDFPDFFAENYQRLCNRIPLGNIQLKNLVLSAIPTTSGELPNPFATGLNHQLLHEMHVNPSIWSGYQIILGEENLLKLLNSACDSPAVKSQDIEKITLKLQSIATSQASVDSKKTTNRFAVFSALVLHICVKALSINEGYEKSSNHAKTVRQLATSFDQQDRYLLINAIVDQLRFPSSHTRWTLGALLDIFSGEGAPPELQEELMELVTRTLVERLHVHRPHPWGVIVALIELYNNPTYQFWDLPFVKAGPDVEKLFHGLNNHIHSGPRALA